MVFFSCNACGQSVKKNQVEKHYQFQCRNCEVLSCMDCGKEFLGDEYKSHTKCISEEAKYGAKDAKVSTPKGEAKQDQWIMNIQEKINSTNVRPVMSNMLTKLLTFPNIPRKQVKFERFIENSLKLYDKRLISELWDVVNIAPNEASGQTLDEIRKDQEKHSPKKWSSENVKNEIEESVCSRIEPSPAKQKKMKKKHREKEANRQENVSDGDLAQHDDFKIDCAIDNTLNGENAGGKQKIKKRKKKDVDNLDIETEIVTSVKQDSTGDSRKENKKKRKKSGGTEGVEPEMTMSFDDISTQGNGAGDAQTKKKKKRKKDEGTEDYLGVTPEMVMSFDGAENAQKEIKKKRKMNEGADDSPSVVPEMAVSFNGAGDAQNEKKKKERKKNKDFLEQHGELKNSDVKGFMNGLPEKESQSVHEQVKKGKKKKHKRDDVDSCVQETSSLDFSKDHHKKKKSKNKFKNVE